MNIKNLFQKPTPKKLNATTRRASLPVAQDYDTDEPNVRLSRAFLVVMLLHVVAVGGIFAFSSIKKNNHAPIEVTPAETVAAKPDSLPSDSRTYIVAASDTLGSIASTFGLTRNDLETANNLTESSAIRPGDKLVIPTKSTSQPVPLNVQKLLQLSQTPKTAKMEATRPVKEAAVVAVPKPVKTAQPIAPAATGEVKYYTVQKGDNPVGIAKKQGIKYVDLLEANKITDPKKLQIGQKLIIPQK